MKLHNGHTTQRYRKNVNEKKDIHAFQVSYKLISIKVGNYNIFLFHYDKAKSLAFLFKFAALLLSKITLFFI